MVERKILKDCDCQSCREDRIRKETERMVYQRILINKFKGNVREMLIWLGGGFKDVEIDLSPIIAKAIPANNDSKKNEAVKP